MNSVQISGKIGNMQYKMVGDNNNTPMFKAIVRIQQVYEKANGELKNTFHAPSIVAWGDVAKRMNDELNDGDYIEITKASLNTSSYESQKYTDENGKAARIFSTVVNVIDYTVTDEE